MKIEREPVANLRRRRQTLVRQLPPLKAVLHGSLIERFERCGQPGCKCAEGPGHGPKYYLSVSRSGLQPRMDYVPQESHAQVAELVANYHRAREILEAISEINSELLRRLRQQLFVYRDLMSWLNDPFQAPPGLDGVHDGQLALEFAR